MRCARTDLNLAKPDNFAMSVLTCSSETSALIDASYCFELESSSGLAEELRVVETIS